MSDTATLRTGVDVLCVATTAGFDGTARSRTRRPSGPSATYTREPLTANRRPFPEVACAAARTGLVGSDTSQLIEPGTVWAGYLNQLDLRLSKLLRIGRYRLRGDANLYNVFNNDFVNSVNTTFSTTAGNQFMRPTNALQGRLFKIGGQIEF